MKNNKNNKQKIDNYYNKYIELFIPSVPDTSGLNFAGKSIIENLFKTHLQKYNRKILREIIRDLKSQLSVLEFSSETAEVVENIVELIKKRI